MSKKRPFSFSILRPLSLCLSYTCIYLALAGQSSCSGSGTKTFGNAPGSNSSTTLSSSNAVSSASFDGLVSVSSVDYRSVSLAYGKSVGAVSLNIYCTVGKNATTYTLVGNLPNILAAGGSGTLSGISSGTTHTCYALPVNAASIETALKAGESPVTVSFQTLSYLQNAYRNIAIVKAYGDTLNPITSPTNRMVSITWVPISDSTLSGMTYRVYRTRKGVVPNLDGATSNSNCISDTSTNSATCKVNCATGSSLGMMGTALTCIDNAVATAPARYWYFISLVPSSSVGTLHFEEPPLPPSTLTSVTPAVSFDAYLVDVPIPPDEMVLVHRDSVNYEFCQLIGRGSTDLAYIDGRVTPTGPAIAGRGVLYDNRCLFGSSSTSAPGALPLNSNPFGSPISFPNAADGKGYYDFGYNLFIDRWELACNWSPASGVTQPDGSVGTGMCSTSALTPQSCYGGVSGVGYAVTYAFNAIASLPNGVSKPANSSGNNGNVFWEANQAGMCWLKENNTWKATGYDPTISLSNLSAAFTLKKFYDPATSPTQYVGAPAHFRTQTTAARACQSQTAAGYNRTKRLLRRREFVAAAAWPSAIDQYNPEKLPPVTLNRVSTNVNSALSPVLTSAAGCHNPLSTVGARANYGAAPYSGASFATGIGTTFGTGPYVTGSAWSKNCVSRYGAQDIIGNMGEWSSDQYTCSGTGTSFTCAPVASSSNFYDNGADQSTQFNDGVAPRPSPSTTQGLFVINWAQWYNSTQYSQSNPFGYLNPQGIWGGTSLTGSTGCPLGTASGCGMSISNFNHWFWNNSSTLPAATNQLNGIHPALGFPTPIGFTNSMTNCDSLTGACPISSSFSNIDPQLQGFSMDSQTSTISTLAPINGGANTGGAYYNGVAWSYDMINSTRFQFNPSRYNVTLYPAEGTRFSTGAGGTQFFEPGVPFDASQSPFTGARCGFSPD